MNTFDFRSKVLEEIKLIPEDKLAGLYDFVHHFRLGLQVSEGGIRQVMKYAGSWKDMSEENYAQFSEEVLQRRSRALS